MQRRAAAIFAVFFVVAGAGAYGLIATAEQPHIKLDSPTYGVNDTLTVGDRTYTVASLSLEESSGGGGHGGGGGASFAGELTWTNQSALYTAELANNSTVPYNNDTYRVLVPNGSNVSSFTMTQEFNVTQRLAADPAVDNETITRNGSRYVVYSENETLRLLSEYLPEPDNQEFQTGDQLQYQNNSTTVQSVSESGVTVGWNAPRTNTIDLSQGGNVTLSGQDYVVNFISEEEVQLSPNYENYAEEQAKVTDFEDTINGLWGIIILSLLAVIFILSFAYLPRKG
ncbi:hypothetical protein ACFQH3_14070 [Haladaptatus sp. GCM10025707]|uniref:hypothetical protein n=1 Tax=unclassified Haladaptatus TaxID=2622732 RepID=UPI0023E8F4E1|nr:MULTISPECIES: hypothetical protein [unclassified Haladaptatus]